MSSDQWVILELSSKADGEDPDLIRRSVTYAIKGAEVFVPAAVTQRGEDKVVHYLVEGYAFIRHVHTEQQYGRLENSRYVQAVVTKPGRSNGSGRVPREFACITTKDIEKMKRQIHSEVDQGIGEGDLVLITSGAYKQIQARVIEDIPENDTVQVHVLLRSKDTIVSLPRSFLRLVQKAPKPPVTERFSTLREWFNDNYGVLGVDTQSLPDWASLSRKYLSFDGVQRLASRLENTHTIQNLVSRGLSVEGVKKQWDKLFGFLRFTNPWYELVPAVRDSAVPNLTPVEDRYLRLLTIVSYLEQFEEMGEEVLDIEDQMEFGMADNVIVDGYNLAYRCLYAPGMSEMRDTMGRPTGVLFGFIRVLASMCKKFPGAKIHVTWDGSSRRRKEKFPEYKANRHTEAISVPAQEGVAPWDQVAWLRQFLPVIGVAQAFNPEEEADDVIASLVRGPLVEHENVILSNDRDLLQLITPKTRLLVPTQGKRRETLFDTDKVKEEWGVTPDRLVSLRALLGDTSDNIPGVPTVPQKVLTDLLNEHGSISAIYNSSLAGLTKIRYNHLRTAKAQVFLNLDLMTLQDVPFTAIEPKPNHDDAVRWLADVDVQSDSLVVAFFGDKEVAV